MTRRFEKIVHLLNGAESLDRWLVLRWMIAERHRWHLDVGGDPADSEKFTDLLEIVRRETASDLAAVAVNLRGTYDTGEPCPVLDTACDLLCGMSAILCEEVERLPAHLEKEVEQARESP